MFALCLPLLSIVFLVSQPTRVISGPENTAAAIYFDKQWKALEPSPDEAGSVKPFPPSDNSYESPTTEIYISIGNFMDGDRCAKTIDNYISKAKYPKRLNFGIIEQINTEVVPFREGCVATYCKLHHISAAECHFENIKTVTYSYRLARGLSYAR